MQVTDNHASASWSRPLRGVGANNTRVHECAHTPALPAAPTLRVELVGHVLAQHPGVAPVLDPGGAIPQPHPRHGLLKHLVQPPQRLLRTAACGPVSVSVRRGRRHGCRQRPHPAGPPTPPPSAHLHLHHVPQQRRHVAAGHRRPAGPGAKLAGRLVAAAVQLLQPLAVGALYAHVAQQGLLQRGNDLRKGAAEALDDAGAAGCGGEGGGRASGKGSSWCTPAA